MSYFTKIWRQLNNYIQSKLNRRVVTSEYGLSKVAFPRKIIAQIVPHNICGTTFASAVNELDEQFVSSDRVGKNFPSPLENQTELSADQANNSPLSNQRAKDGKTFLLQNKLKNSLHRWLQDCGSVEFNHQDQQIYQQIYDLLGSNTLNADIVSEIIHKLAKDNELGCIKLFECLENFYQLWCCGEFIDAPPSRNLPQQKMLELNQVSGVPIGLRQVDVNAGLNVMILLLELQRIASKSNNLKDKIQFYPSGKPDTGQEDFFTSKLLRVIHYTDAIAIGNFSNLAGEFLYGNNFSRAYLGDANLINVNLEDANLSNCYLGDANLTSANLAKADLKFANLGDANLSGANLSGANLENADLSGADLSGANLKGANLSHANLSTADLNNTDLSNANLNRTNLTSAIIRDANLNSANLSHAILFSANLSDTLLKRANLEYADLCRTDLSGANLTHANIKGANISDSILFSTNLNYAVLLSADLSYSKLNGAELSQAILENAILIGADLSDTSLIQAILCHSDLSGANLSKANLTQADLSDGILIGTDFSSSKLNSADLSSTNLSGAIFNSANLSNVNFAFSILTETDFTYANLKQISWSKLLDFQDVRGLEKAVNVPTELLNE